MSAWWSRLAARLRRTDRPATDARYRVSDGMWLDPADGEDVYAEDLMPQPDPVDAHAEQAMAVLTPDDDALTIARYCDCEDCDDLTQYGPPEAPSNDALPWVGAWAVSRLVDDIYRHYRRQPPQPPLMPGRES